MESMSPQDLAARLDDAQTTIVDVRSLKDYETAHVPGAEHIPVAEIKESVPDLPKEHLIVTY